MDKKAQAQIITTVLIILLVLAAIVIVWQVVQSTVRGGAEEVEKQSACLGLTIEITNIDTAGTGSVTIRPNKDIDDYRVFVAGSQHGNDGGVALGAFTTATVSGNTGESIIAGNKVEAAGQIDGVWCAGKSSDTAS